MDCGEWMRGAMEKENGSTIREQIDRMTVAELERCYDEYLDFQLLRTLPERVSATLKNAETTYENAMRRKNKREDLSHEKYVKSFIASEDAVFSDQVKYGALCYDIQSSFACINPDGITHKRFDAKRAPECYIRQYLTGKAEMQGKQSYWEDVPDCRTAAELLKKFSSAAKSGIDKKSFIPIPEEIFSLTIGSFLQYLKTKEEYEGNLKVRVKKSADYFRSHCGMKYEGNGEVLFSSISDYLFLQAEHNKELKRDLMSAKGAHVDAEPLNAFLTDLLFHFYQDRLSECEPTDSKINTYGVACAHLIIEAKKRDRNLIFETGRYYSYLKQELQSACYAALKLKTGSNPYEKRKAKNSIYRDLFLVASGKKLILNLPKAQWIDIASALQSKYRLFGEIGDSSAEKLNEFRRALCGTLIGRDKIFVSDDYGIDLTVPDEAISYGAVMRGWSAEETFFLKKFFSESHIKTVSASELNGRDSREAEDYRRLREVVTRAYDESLAQTDKGEIPVRLSREKDLFFVLYQLALDDPFYFEKDDNSTRRERTERALSVLKMSNEDALKEFAVSLLRDERKKSALQTECFASVAKWLKEGDKLSKEEYFRVLRLLIIHNRMQRKSRDIATINADLAKAGFPLLPKRLSECFDPADAYFVAKIENTKDK